MSAGADVNPETSAPRQSEATRPPEGSERSSTWTSWAIGWALVSLFVIYPLSIIPAYVALLVLRRHGIDFYAPYEVFYWPIIWLLRNVALLRRLNDLIEPLLRGLVR
jgi:hypothetical protein